MPELGPFVVEHPIAAGAIGTVWSARHIATGFPVAIKACPPGFTAELDALARLRHPAIVEVLDGGDVPAGHPVLGPGTWLAMERGSGTLHGHLGTLEWPVIRRVGERLLQALAAAHGAGVLHRDVKPSNVLVGCRRSLLQPLSGPLDGLRLADFGLAWSAGRDAGTPGTPGYAAPEQRTGQSLGPWTDLYGWSALLWALVTGGPPTTSALQPAMAVPEGLEALLRRGLAAADARFQHPAEALHALEDLGEPVTPRSVSPVSPTPFAATTQAVVQVLAPKATTAATPRTPVVRPERLPVPDVAWPSAALLDAGRGLWSRRPLGFVGREDALEALHAACRPGAVVGVCGPAGVGVTRVVDTFLARLGAVFPIALDDRRAEPTTVLPAHGMPVIVVDAGAEVPRPGSGVVLVDGGPAETTVMLEPLDPVVIDGLWLATGFTPSTVARLAVRFGPRLGETRAFLDVAMAEDAVRASTEGFVVDVPLAPPARSTDELLNEMAEARVEGRARDVALLGTLLEGAVLTDEQDHRRKAAMVHGAVHLLDAEGRHLVEQVQNSPFIDLWERADLERWQATVRSDRSAALISARAMLSLADTPSRTVQSRRAVGWEHVVQGNWEEAERMFAEALDDPACSVTERIKVIQGRGLMAERRQRPDEALHHYQTAAALCEGSTDLLVQRTLFRFLFNLQVRRGERGDASLARALEAAHTSGDLRVMDSLASGQVPHLFATGQHDAARRLAIQLTGSLFEVTRFVSWVNLGLDAVRRRDVGLLARVVEGTARGEDVAPDGRALRCLFETVLAALERRREVYEACLRTWPNRWRNGDLPPGEFTELGEDLAGMVRRNGWPELFAPS